MNDIQTLLVLSTNPHYILSDEELARLRQYQFEKMQEDEIQNAINKNTFPKNDNTIPTVS